MKKNVTNGSCLCKQVKIEITGSIDSIIHCHCSLCRKSSGTAFATNGFVQRAGFAITQGEDRLSQFAFKPGRIRHFCQDCGSPIFSENLEDPTRIRLRLGILDDDSNNLPISHNFVSSKANWDPLDKNLPEYDSFEPGRIHKQNT